MRDVERRMGLLERRPAGTGITGGGGGTIDGSVVAGGGLYLNAGAIHVGQGSGVIIQPDSISLDTTFTDGKYLSPNEVLAGDNISLDYSSFPGSVIISATDPTAGQSHHYRHDQTSLSSVWTVNHNLGFHPAVHIEDAVGTVMYGDIQHTSSARLTITFTQSITGSAHCS